MPNPVVHFEIIGKDGKKLQEWCSSIFGWKINADNPMNYGIVEAQGSGIGGGVGQGDGSTSVTVYIAVDDPQAQLDKVESLGGKTVMPVTEIPGMVTLAQFADPEGNVVGIAAAVALSIGTLADSDAASVAGAVAVGLGIIVAVSAPHEWVKRIYPRLDKLDPNDP